MPPSADRPTDPDCLFCKIIAGAIPCHRIFETDDVLSFLDIGPLARGHILLIPKGHFVTIDAMPDELVAACGAAVPRLSRALKAVTGQGDFNLLQNNGSTAGQVVMHVHFHLIPRASGDGLGYRWPAGKLDAGEAEQLKNAFAQALE